MPPPAAAGSKPGDLSKDVQKLLERCLPYGYVPPSAAPPLIALLRRLPDSDRKEQRKAARLLPYLAQLVLGPGSAGTPLPLQPGLNPAAVLPKAADATPPATLLQATAAATKPSAPFPARAAALRMLSALTRAGHGSPAAAGASPLDDANYLATLVSTSTSLLSQLEAGMAGLLGSPPAAAGGARAAAAAAAAARKGNLARLVESAAMQRAVLGALRSGLPAGVTLAEAAPQLVPLVMAAAASPDAGAAGHALALAACVAVTAPQLYMEHVGPLLDVSVAVMQQTMRLPAGGTAGVAGVLRMPSARVAPEAVPEGSSPSAAATNGEGGASEAAAAAAPATPARPAFSKGSPVLNMQDPWARVALARGCSAVLFSQQVRGDVAGVGAAYWRMLALLATTDASDMVAFEAIRAMCGAPPAEGAQLGDGPAAAATGAAGGGKGAVAATTDALQTPAQAAPGGRAYAAAWDLLNMPEATGGGGAVGAATCTTLERVATRLAGCQSQSNAVLASACHAMLAVATSRAWAVAAAAAAGAATGPEDRIKVDAGGGTGCATAGGKIAMIKTHALMRAVATDASLPPYQRCLALEVLLWLNLPGDSPAVALSPADVQQMVSRGGGASGRDPWPPALLQRLAGTLHARLLPAAGQLAGWGLAVLDVLIQAAPGHMPLTQLEKTLDVVLRADAGAAAAVVQRCLAWLSQPAPAVALPPAGASESMVSAAAKQAAAWLQLQRFVAWWLGENANFATSIYAWDGGHTVAASLAAVASAASVAASKAGGGLGEAELLACASAAHSPVLAATIGHLHRAIGAAGWELRVAAAQALAKIAVRSCEPYRIQCYSLLQSAVAPAAASSPGFSGAAVGSATGAALPAADAAAADPLGLRGALSPALQVLDALYASETKLEQLVTQYGKTPAGWPPAALASLRQHSDALVAAICNHVCFVPKAIYFPLGPRSKALLQPDSAAAAAAAAATADGAAPASAQAAAFSSPLKEQTGVGGAAGGGGGLLISFGDSPASATHSRTPSSSQRSFARSPGAGAGASGGGAADLWSMLDWSAVANETTSLDGCAVPAADTLTAAGGNPTAAAVALLTKTDSAGSGSSSATGASGRGLLGAMAAAVANRSLRRNGSTAAAAADVDSLNSSDDDEGAHGKKGTVLFDFNPETEEEIAVRAGDVVSVEFDIGGWLHVVRADGTQGLVPVSYVSVTGSSGGGAAGDAVGGPGSSLPSPLGTAAAAAAGGSPSGAAFGSVNPNAGRSSAASPSAAAAAGGGATSGGAAASREQGASLPTGVRAFGVDPLPLAALQSPLPPPKAPSSSTTTPSSLSTSTLQESSTVPSPLAGAASGWSAFSDPPSALVAAAAAASAPAAVAPAAPVTAAAAAASASPTAAGTSAGAASASPPAAAAAAPAAAAGVAAATAAAAANGVGRSDSGWKAFDKQDELASPPPAAPPAAAAAVTPPPAVAAQPVEAVQDDGITWSQKAPPAAAVAPEPQPEPTSPVPPKPSSFLPAAVGAVDAAAPPSTPVAAQQSSHDKPPVTPLPVATPGPTAPDFGTTLQTPSDVRTAIRSLQSTPSSAVAAVAAAATTALLPPADGPLAQPALPLTAPAPSAQGPSAPAGGDSASTSEAVSPTAAAAAAATAEDDDEEEDAGEDAPAASAATAAPAAGAGAGGSKKKKKKKKGKK